MNFEILRRNREEVKTDDPRVIKMRADNLFKNQDYPAAQELYRIILQKEPNQAIDILQKFNKQILVNPYDINLRLALSELFQLVGDTDNAISELEEVIEIKPNQLEACQMLSRLYYKLGQGEKVLGIMHYFPAYDQIDTPVLEFLAKVHVREKRFLEARPLYEFLIKTEPKLLWIKALAQIFLELNEMKSWLELQKEMRRIHPQSATYIIEEIQKLLSRDDLTMETEIYQLYGDAYLATVQPEKAVEQYQKITQINEGGTDKSIENYKRLLTLFPEFGPAMYELSLLYIKVRDFTQAISLFKNLVEHHPGYFAKIVKGLRIIIEACPEQIMAYQVLGELLLQKGQVEEALNYFLELLVKNPQDAPAIVAKMRDLLVRADDVQKPAIYLTLARALFETGDYDEALEAADLYLGVLPPDSLEGYCLKANIFSRKQQWSEALTFALKANEKDVSRKDIHQLIIACDDAILLGKQNIKPEGEQSLLHLGALYYEYGEIDRSIEYLQKASGENFRTGYVLAKCFKELGRFDLSLPQWQKLAGLDPKQALFELGTIMETVGQIDEAVNVYKNLERIDINYPGLQERVSQIGSTALMNIRGKTVIALAAELGQEHVVPIFVKNPEVEQYIKAKKKNITPSLANPHNDRGVDYLFKYQFQAADEEFKMARQIDPGLTAIFNNHAVLHMVNGDMVRAYEELEKAMNINPKLSIVHLNLGTYFLMQSDYKEAIKCFNKAFLLNRKLLFTQLNLGDVYYMMGKVHQAIDAWERFLDQWILPELALRRLRMVKRYAYNKPLIPFEL